MLSALLIVVLTVQSSDTSDFIWDESTRSHPIRWKLTDRDTTKEDEVASTKLFAQINQAEENFSMICKQPDSQTMWVMHREANLRIQPNSCRKVPKDHFHKFFDRDIYICNLQRSGERISIGARTPEEDHLESFLGAEFWSGDIVSQKEAAAIFIRAKVFVSTHGNMDWYIAKPARSLIRQGTSWAIQTAMVQQAWYWRMLMETLNDELVCPKIIRWCRSNITNRTWDAGVKLFERRLCCRRNVTRKPSRDRLKSD